MFNQITFLVIIFLSFNVYGQNEREILIDFELNNCPEKVAYLEIYSEDFRDTLVCNSSKPRMGIPSEFPTYFNIKAIHPSNKEQKSGFYADVGVNKVVLDFNDFKSIEIQGSKTDEENRTLIELNKDNNLAIRYNNELAGKNRIHLSEIKYSKKIDSIELVLEKLSKEREYLIHKNLKNQMEFYHQNHNSFLALENLSLWVNKSIAIPFMDDMESIYNRFSEEYKNTVYGKRMKSSLNSYQISKTGQVIPNLILKDTHNKSIHVHDNKKFTLIDFWASWCAPCIQDFPRLKEIKLKNDKHLRVIAISNDENLDSWQTGIQKYDLIQDFIHISNKQNHTLELKYNFFVNAIPVKILINEKGKVLGRWNGGGNEHLDEIEQKIENNFIE